MKVRKPILCVVAGPNGSGKTTTTVQLLNNEWTATTEGQLFKKYTDDIPEWAELLLKI